MVERDRLALGRAVDVGELREQVAHALLRQAGAQGIDDGVFALHGGLRPQDASREAMRIDSSMMPSASSKMASGVVSG